MEAYLRKRYDMFDSTQKVFTIEMISLEVLINVEPLKTLIRTHINPKGRNSWAMDKENFVAMVLLIINRTEGDYNNGKR